MIEPDSDSSSFKRGCDDDDGEKKYQSTAPPLPPPPTTNNSDQEDQEEVKEEILTTTVSSVAPGAAATAPPLLSPPTTSSSNLDQMEEVEEEILTTPTSVAGPSTILTVTIDEKEEDEVVTADSTSPEQPTPPISSSSDNNNNDDDDDDSHDPKTNDVVNQNTMISSGSAAETTKLLLQSELEKADNVNEMIITPAPSRDDYHGDHNNNNDEDLDDNNGMISLEPQSQSHQSLPPTLDKEVKTTIDMNESETEQTMGVNFVPALPSLTLEEEEEENHEVEETSSPNIPVIMGAAPAAATATASTATTAVAALSKLEEGSVPIVVTEGPEESSNEVPSSSLSSLPASEDCNDDNNNTSISSTTTTPLTLIPLPPTVAGSTTATPDYNNKKLLEEDTTEQLSSSSPSSSVCYSADSGNPFEKASYITSSTTTNASTTPNNKDKGSKKDDNNNNEIEPSTPLTEAPTMFFGDSDHNSQLSSSSSEEEEEDANCHTRTIYKIHGIIIKVLQNISSVAVNFPKTTLIGFSLLSVGLVTAGLFTNFHVETQTHDLWPPQDSLSLDHAYWLIDDSYFGYDPVQLDIIIHKNGQNVLGKAGVERVFEVQTIFTNQRGYKEGCAWAELFGDLYWVGQCSIDTVTDFWNESIAIFEETVRNDEDAIQYLSKTVYPNGVLVDVDTIMGKTKRDTTTTATDDVEDGLLTNAQSYLIKFNIPWSNVTLDFEQDALQRMLLLREEWEARGDEFILEVRSHSSYSQEFLRAIQADLWLLPIACAIVALFTVFFAFGKCHRVESRGLLGIGAVLTIVASLMSSFGIMFLLGIPFTTQTIMIPFLMFGIGLDDAFILYGSYNRKSHIKDVKQRIRSTIKDVGVSIFLTSLTSMLAFVLGSFSQIPAVRWLCQYAYPCIGIDFLYQITFFIALIVVDERRIQEGRMDYCTCIKVAERQEEVETDGYEENAIDTEAGTSPSAVAVPQHVEEDAQVPQKHVADRFMGWWATQLLNPRIQTAALVAFAALAAGSVACATQLEQEFDFADLVPADSYVKSYYNSLDAFTTRNGEHSYAYFRDVDQGNPEVQAQMEAYIDDLVEKANVDEPVYFWLRDFRKFLADAPYNSTLHDLPFHWQIREFLKEDIYYELYDRDIGRSRRGVVFETRVAIHINVDIHGTQETTEMLSTLREVSGSQPINQDAESGDEWKFFTYIGQYHLYEFYNQVVRELIFTTIMGVIAVNLIAFCFIPHWTAVLFVLPFISLLYINMLGWLYLAGVQINAISYVTLVMSIGLMIDYIMHILMRYYDSKGTRQQRVQETLTSMGSSIFLGAASTLLGILCLSMSTSDILQDIFVSCVGLVVFGILNGLIFLPVTLALVGPE